jgi:hypothetical protein
MAVCTAQCLNLEREFHHSARSCAFSASSLSSSTGMTRGEVENERMMWSLAVKGRDEHSHNDRV